MPTFYNDRTFRQHVKPEDIPTPPADYTVIYGSVSITDNTTLLNSWMAMFEALPYHTKVDLGPATYPSANVPNVLEYGFGNENGIPVLLLFGLHGSENQTIAAAYWLAYCCANKVNPFFEWMNENYNMRMIPCANPEGNVKYTRRNNASNSAGTTDDVDLNRNFPWRHGSSPTNTDLTFAGLTAMSELETQYMVERMSTIVESVGTITGTVSVGDEVWQDNSQARGIVLSNTGTGATATLTIRMTSSDWNFMTGTAASYLIENSAGAGQATPIITIVREKPKLVIDCHHTGTNLTKDIQVLCPNYQLISDWEVTKSFVKMAAPIIQDAGGVGVGMPSIGTLNFSQPVGLAQNFSASLGIQAYTFESDPLLWNSDLSIATKEMVRAYAATISCAMVVSPNARLNPVRRIEMLKAPYISSLSAAKTIGPGDDYEWSRRDHVYLATGYVNPGTIFIETMSDIVLTVIGCARGVATAPRLTLVLWLDDVNDVEVGTMSTDYYLIDVPDGKYTPMVGLNPVYHNLPPGTYKVRLKITPSTGAALLYKLTTRVDVIPNKKRETSYSILA